MLYMATTIQTRHCFKPQQYSITYRTFTISCCCEVFVVYFLVRHLVYSELHAKAALSSNLTSRKTTYSTCHNKLHEVSESCCISITPELPTLQAPVATFRLVVCRYLNRPNTCSIIMTLNIDISTDLNNNNTVHRSF